MSFAQKCLPSSRVRLLQVADFNLSRALQGDMVPNSGAMHSLEWAAPEKLSGQRQYNGRAADVFRYNSARLSRDLLKNFLGNT